MRQFLIAAVAVGTMLGGLIPQVAQGQPAVSTPLRQYTSPMGQSLNWLFNPQIAKELEIVPEQKEKLTKIRTEMSTKLRETYKSWGDLDPAERRKKYYKATKALGAETDKQVREVLLDHQLDRLRQIMLQMKLRNAGYGSASALSADDVAGALGLTKEQKKQLQEKEQEIRTATREKTQEFHKRLREESREQLFGVLTEAQRKKLQDLMGEEYEWRTTGWRGGQGGAAPKVQIQKPKQKD